MKTEQTQIACTADDGERAVVVMVRSWQTLRDSEGASEVERLPEFRDPNGGHFNKQPDGAFVRVRDGKRFNP